MCTYRVKYIFGGKEIEIEANSEADAKELAIKRFVETNYYQHKINVDEFAKGINRDYFVCELVNKGE